MLLSNSNSVIFTIILSCINEFMYVNVIYTQEITNLGFDEIAI